MLVINLGLSNDLKAQTRNQDAIYKNLSNHKDHNGSHVEIVLLEFILKEGKLGLELVEVELEYIDELLENAIALKALIRQRVLLDPFPKTVFT